MRKSLEQPRILLAFAGVLALLATVALGAATMRPTEATWQDVVHGESVFGTHPDTGRNYARALSGLGVIERQISTSDVGPARAFADPGTPSAAELLHHNDAGWIAALPLEMVGDSCASASLQSSPACGAAATLPPGTSFASSEMSRLRLWLGGSRSNQLLAYGTSDDQKPISATATCAPGEVGRASVSAGGPVNIRENVALFLPPPNRQTTATHRSSLFTGITGVLQYHRSEGPGWAKAEARLYVTSNEYLAGFTLHVTLASAECGIARDTPAEPQRPTTARAAALQESPNQPSATTAASPASLRSITEVPEQQAAEDPEVVQGTAGPTVDDAENEAELPTLNDAAGDATVEPNPEDEAPVDATVTGPEPTSPATTAPTTTEPAASEQATTEQATPESSAPTPSTEATTSESAEPSTEVEAPQQPESVTVGRWFTVTGPEGVELGSARIADIERTPGCGVELTLSISTSAEAGANRWASIGPDDFAEVRTGGATREATQINSDCEQASTSRTTALLPGSEYEIVVSFLLDDSAQQAMLRPAGTAGWIFDLPPLTQVAEATQVVGA